MEPAGPARVERRLAAILAADVAGYSRLMGADEEGTLERLKALRRKVEGPQASPAVAAGISGGRLAGGGTGIRTLGPPVRKTGLFETAPFECSGPAFR